MNFLKKIINRETITYLTFGVLTTAVNYAVFAVFFYFLGKESALISNLFAFVIAVIFAYITNKLFVFQSKSWHPSVLKNEIPAFVAARLLSFGIEELGILLAADVFAINKTDFLGINGMLYVKLALSVVVIIMNYFFSKFIIFKPKQNK